MNQISNGVRFFQIIMWIFSGFILGIAVLVPGLSVGTLAVVMGIYDKIVCIAARALPFSRRANQLPDKLFIGCISIGIGLSIFILTEGVLYVLQYYPFPVYSIFTGLILASLPVLFKEVQIKKHFIWCIVAAFVVFNVSVLFVVEPAIQSSPSLWLYFLSGFLGCFFAVLPGLSGSMALLLLGTYHFVLLMLNTLVWIHLAMFLAGGMIGLACIFYCLQFLFKKNKSFIFSIILGFIIGSLPRVFPWQHWNIESNISFFITTFSFMMIGVGLFFLINYLCQPIHSRRSI